ncbi:hypothetical protein K488DRAFT_64965 [Vararia minispora EC-137]|uniref:Uncharacterized protein n=1 Tax=Vararia minispora EC-137 TaxID=1314806 RepID=A0ACB8Q4L2_9AGAM|nr:hypothetical protein K488DRAFT_64965 [Vararia minispora EC-137]
MFRHSQTAPAVKPCQQLYECPGQELDFPPTTTASTAYPFILHDRDHRKRPLCWGYEYDQKNGRFALHASACMHFSSQTNIPCDECSSLLSEPIVIGILARAQDGVNSSTPYAYLGLGHMLAILRGKNTTIKDLHLRRMNTACHIDRLVGSLDAHKELMVALSSRWIQRIDAVLRACMRRKASIWSILETVEKAAKGVYHPRGCDEEEELQALLFYRLGGGRLLDVAHRTHGLLALSTVRHRITLVVIAPSPARPTRSLVEANITAIFEPIHEILERYTYCMHAELMYDEIAVERRPRYEERSNRILGTCREHEHVGGREFSSLDDLDQLANDINCHDVHYAHEATVGAIGLLTDNPHLYSARPILISGSCKQETAEEHMAVIQTTLDAANAQKRLTRACIVCLSSDGEARHGKAFVQLTFKRRLSEESPIYDFLSPLALMDMHIGDDDLTANKDAKHIVFKRFCNTLLRDKGVLVHGVFLTPAILHTHFRDAGMSSQHINSVLNVTDLQDVENAYRLHRDLWSLGEADATKYDDLYIQTCNAIRLFGDLCFHAIYPFICVDLSLSEQLEYLSCAAHMLLVLYTHNSAKADFLPTALYVDTQILIKNVFFCVAKAKVDFPDSKYFIYNLGTDRLETQFGILRTMVGNDTNLDILQLAHRISGTTDVATILAKHPEWDSGPRRLRIPPIQRDTRAIPGIDHISPRTWRGDLRVQTVTLATAWKRGRLMAEEKHSWLAAHLTSISETPDVSALSPFGTLLVRGDLPEDSDDTPYDQCTELLDQEPDLGAVSELGNGLQQLEEAAEAALACFSDTKSTSFSKKLFFQGGEVNKSRLLAQHFRYEKTASSTDRLRRVQCQTRYGPGAPQGAGPEDSLEDSSDGPALAIGHPVAMLLSCQDKLWLAVGEVNGIRRNGQHLEHIPISVICDQTVAISFQVVLLTLDPSQTNRWRSDSLLPIRASVPGTLVRPLDPDVISPAPEKVLYTFQTDELISLASNLRLQVVPRHTRSIAMVKIHPQYPYCELKGSFPHIFV